MCGAKSAERLEIVTDRWARSPLDLQRDEPGPPDTRFRISEAGGFWDRSDGGGPCPNYTNERWKEYLSHVVHGALCMTRWT